MFETAWSCPSNIALVKYWGKKEGELQIPANPSLSFTLSACTTSCHMHVEAKPDDGNFSLHFTFDGERKPSFIPKILTFFERIESLVPWLKTHHITIATSNTFPHSSGIASSASAFAAMAQCLSDIHQQMGNQVEDPLAFASELARIGSGSAARSLMGPCGVWGKHADFEGSNDRYSIAFADIHPIFQDFRDTILIVESGKKSVSSTAGHELMVGHPFAEARYQQAHRNLSKLKDILMHGQLDLFYELVEEEAMTLHAMMMTGNPSYMLFKPETIAIIERLRDARKQKGLSMCFTLDAGANVHVLYPNSEHEKVMNWINEEVAQYLENQHYLCDQIGNGAKRIDI
jgi:diphosphomevalonate decarboxylase